MNDIPLNELKIKRKGKLYMMLQQHIGPNLGNLDLPLGNVNTVHNQELEKGCAITMRIREMIERIRNENRKKPLKNQENKTEAGVVLIEMMVDSHESGKEN